MGTRIRRLLTGTALGGACLLLALPASAQGERQAAEELAADLAAVLDQPAIGPAEATPVPAPPPPAPVAEPVGETLDQGLDAVEDVPAPSPVQEVVADVTSQVRTVTGTPDDDGRPNLPGGTQPDPGDGTPPTPVRQAGGTTTPAAPSDADVQVLALDSLRARVGATSLRGFRTDARRAAIATVTADDALVPLAATAPPTARTTIEPIGGQVPQLPTRIGVEGLVAAALLVLATAGLLAELGPRRST